MSKLWFILMTIFSTAPLIATDNGERQDEIHQVYQENIRKHDNLRDEACRVLQQNIRKHISWQQDMYGIGLEFRDGKIDGSPKEQYDTYALAGWHFLPLAWAGNVKAQHNFAWVKFKQGDFQAACRWYEKAANQGFEPSFKNLQKVKEEINKSIWRISNEVLLIIISCLTDNDLLNFRTSARHFAEFVEIAFKNRSEVQTPLVCLKKHPYPITASYFLRNNLFNIWSISIDNILQKPKTFLQCADFCKIYNYKGERVFRYLGSINPKSFPEIEVLNQELEDKLFIGDKSQNMDDQELTLSAYINKIRRLPDDEKIIDQLISLAKEMIGNGGKAFSLPNVLGCAKFLRVLTNK